MSEAQQSGTSRSWFPASNTIIGMQMLILGCLFFLVMIEMGEGQETAGNLLLIAWVAAFLMIFAPALQYVVEDIVEWWGGRHA